MGLLQNTLLVYSGTMQSGAALDIADGGKGVLIVSHRSPIFDQESHTSQSWLWFPNISVRSVLTRASEKVKQFQINDRLSKVELPKQKVFKAKLEFFTQQ